MQEMRKKFISFTALILSDMAVILLCFALGYFIRLVVISQLLPPPRNQNLQPFSVFLSRFYMILVWLIVFAREKLYTKRPTFWDETKLLIRSSTYSSILIMISIFLTKTQIQFSRTIVISAWAISLVLLPLSRWALKLMLVRFGVWKKDLLIIGVHQTSLMVLKTLMRNRTMGYRVTGFLDDDPGKVGKTFGGVKVLGTTADLEKISNHYDSKDIMFATPHVPRSDLRTLLTKCENISESMWLIPRSGDFITEGVEIEILGEVLTLYIKKNLAKPWNTLLKTFYEKMVTAVAVLLLLPLFLVIGIAIKLDSPGPILYFQDRVGKRKELFRLFKFRSMHIDGDHKLDDYLESRPDARKEWETYRKLRNHDPRVTRVGRIIRKFSLDELPQLFNVLQGTMSLVGPRPYLASELKGKERFLNIVAQVKPGVTGLWQVSGRNELPFQARLQFDEYYIRNWSLWLDITILIKSIQVMLSSKGAY